MVAPAEHIQPRAGRASLEVQLVSGECAVTASYATNPLKLLTPRARGQSVWACTSSFGGGLVAGDQTRLDLHLGPGARCYLGTQASTKIYRNPAALPSGHETHATLEAGSLLVFAPDPVQAFANSTYTQRQEFHLASDASLVLLDWFIAGRTARGERWEFSRLQSRNEVWCMGSVSQSLKATGENGSFDEISPLTPALSPLRGEGGRTAAPAHDPPVTPFAAAAASSGEQAQTQQRTHKSRRMPTAAPSPLNEERAGARGESAPDVAKSQIVFLDSIRLSPDDGPLDSPHRTGRFNCLATLLLVGPLVRALAASLLADVAARPVERRAPLVCRAGPLRDGALLRVAGEQVESVARELHHHLAALASLLGDDPWQRKW